jgi:hypothetical protein
MMLAIIISFIIYLFVIYNVVPAAAACVRHLAAA